MLNTIIYKYISMTVIYFRKRYLRKWKSRIVDIIYTYWLWPSFKRYNALFAVKTIFPISMKQKNKKAYKVIKSRYWSLFCKIMFQKRFFIDASNEILM